METLPVARLWLLVLVSAAAGGFDLHSRRIPNAITVPGAIAGFAAAWVYGGWPALRGSLLGFTAAFAVYLVFFLAGGRGGGDLKLMAAMGAILGFKNWLLLFVIASVFGGVVALLVLLWRKGPAYGLRLRRKLSDSDALTLPHGAIIAAAALLLAFGLRPQ